MAFYDDGQYNDNAGLIQISAVPNCITVNYDTVYICKGDSIDLLVKNRVGIVWNATEPFNALVDSSVNAFPITSTIYTATSSNMVDSISVIVENCLTDLEVTKTDGVPIYERSQNTIYTIVAKNNGPTNVQNATVSDPIPNGINNLTWTAVFHGTASNTEGTSGSGSLADNVNLAVGDSIVYTVTAAVSGAKYGDLVNTATINTPTGMEDLDSTNNVAIDVDADPDPTSCFIMMTDFEDYVNCTAPSYDQFAQAYSGNSAWVNSNHTAGLFVHDPGICSNLPDNILVPHTDGGTGYAGLHSPLTGNTQEVIIGTLPTNLVANQEYEISFIAYSIKVRKQAVWDNYGQADFFGIEEGTNPILNVNTQKNWTTIQAIPEVDHLGTSTMINNRTQWEEYSFKFTPSRNYDRLLLAPRGDWAFIGIDNIIVKVAAQTINVDTVTVCSDIPNVSLPYEITSGNPDQYSIDWDAAANAAGIADVLQTNLPVDSQFVISNLGSIASGIYTAEVSVYNTLLGCEGIDSIYLIIAPVSDIELRDTAFCLGGEVTLDAGIHTTYSWNVGNETGQTITVDSTFEYKVIVTNQFNCSDSDSVNVTIHDLPIVTLRNDTTVCPRDSVILDAQNATSTYLWNTNETTQTIKVGILDEYDVIVTDTNGCIGKDTFELFNHTLPIVQLRNDTIVCSPEVVVVNAGVWNSYLWSNGSTSDEITLTSTDTVYVDIIDANLCVGSDTIEIQVIALPIVDLGNDTAVCDGESVTIDAENAGLNYDWNTNETTQTITIDAAGIYGVEVTDVYGCLGSDSMELIVNALPIVNLGNDTIICEPESVTINAGNWASYSWNTRETTQEIVVDSTISISVSIVDTNGCRGSDDKEIQVNPLPIIDLGNDTTICINETVTLDAENPGWNYLWNSGEQTQTIIASEGFFKVTVSDAIGCNKVDSITVVIDLIPDPYPIKMFEICEGDNIDLEPDTGYGAFDINWPGLSTTTILNVDEGGNYYSAVTSDYCTDTFMLTVTKIDTPDIALLNLLGRDAACFDHENIELLLVDSNLPLSTCEWSTGETTNNIIVTEEGTYSVTASNRSCSSDKLIDIEEYCLSQLYIPNAFTPNGEGPNDVFIPVPYGDITNYELLVFDRWGEQIFSTHNLNEGWDGTYRGNPCQIDVYVYKATYDFISDIQTIETETKVGTVTLLR